MIRRCRKRCVLRKPLALSASMVGVVAVAVLIGLSAGVSYAQDNGAGGTQSSEPWFIMNLHITGVAQNTSATCIDSNNASRGFGTTSRAQGTTQPGNSDRWGRRSENSLAAERQLVQID